MGASFYHKAVGNAFTGHVDLSGDPMNAALLKSTHVPVLATANVWADVSADESAGTNYPAGGVACANVALTTTEANSWANVAATNTAYAVGDVVRPVAGNGKLYRCEAAGTSGGAAPAWPTAIGATVADGTVVWTCVGSAICRLTCDAITFANVTVADFEFIEFRDATTGYLIAEHDLGAAQGVSASNVTYTPDALGVAWFFIA